MKTRFSWHLAISFLRGRKANLSEKEIDFKKRFADALKSFVYKSSQNAGCVFRIRVLDDPLQNEYKQNSNGSNHSNRCLNILLILWKTLQKVFSP